jgi:hypothetical protein
MNAAASIGLLYLACLLAVFFDDTVQGAILINASKSLGSATAGQCLSAVLES